MATERRPPRSTSAGTTSRPLRRRTPDRPATVGKTQTQHSRGTKILRDGTVVRPHGPRSAKAQTTQSRSGKGHSNSRPRNAQPVRPRRRRPTVRIALAPSPHRLHIVLIAIAIGLSLCAGRLLQLQGFESSQYPADAMSRTLPLLPARGQIVDRNGTVLASTQPAVAVTADPTLTAPKAAEIAGVLSTHLQMPTTELMPLLTKTGTHFVYIKKKVPALTYTALANDLAEREIYGIFRENDPIRTYPNSTVGASVVGFVGADNTGLAGLEYSLNAQLAGVEGKQTFESAPNGSKIPLGNSSLTPARNGVSYQLSLDSEVQWAAQRRIAETVKQTDADSGFVVVMDVKTGQVLALAQAPSMDSARPQDAKAEDRGNRAISAPYEPGSVQKILTAAALLDSGTAKPTTRVEVPSRLHSEGGISIKDHFYHKELRYNMRGIIANSSNIGTALLTRQLSKERLHNYLASFGLGSPTGIELPGEEGGSSRPPPWGTANATRWPSARPCR